MKSETLMMYGGAAVLVVTAYFGVNSVLSANAVENARIESVNKARSISTLIVQDEATFGTSFRDAVKECTDSASDAELPHAVWDHYVDVLKSAVSKAAEENYTPRKNANWFLEAQRAADAQNTIPDTVLSRIKDADKPKLEAAMIDINKSMVEIGECLVQTAQKLPS